MKTMNLRLLCVVLLTTMLIAGCIHVNTMPNPTRPPEVSNNRDDSSDSRWMTQEEVRGNAKWRSDYGPFFAAKHEGPIIPALRQGLVPQSVGYLADDDWFIMGGYRDGTTSLITIVDASTGNQIKTVQFRKQGGSLYQEHAGGLAISDKHLWISSGEHVHFIELNQLRLAMDGDTLQFAGHLKIDARGSFVNYSDGVLWVGDFALEPNYPTKSHHHLINRDRKKHTGWIAGYTLDPNTDLIPVSRPTNNIGAFIPDVALSIPDKIQESSIVGDSIVLTESYGRNNVSHLFVYENPLKEPPHTSVQVGNVTVPVWFLDSKNLTATWTLTPMAEGIVERLGETYIIFESAAQKYLDGSYALSRLQVMETKVLLAGP